MSATKYLRAGLVPVALLSASILNVAQADETASAWETALAETKPIFDFRLRYEGVDQDGLAVSIVSAAITSLLVAGAIASIAAADVFILAS